jgi:hypothetical protein
MAPKRNTPSGILGDAPGPPSDRPFPNNPADPWRLLPFLWPPGEYRVVIKRIRRGAPRKPLVAPEIDLADDRGGAVRAIAKRRNATIESVKRIAARERAKRK